MTYMNAPDWVMLGVTTPEGVIVFASDELTQAELKQEVDADIWSLGAYHVVDTLKHYEISAEMRSLKWAIGEDYAEAIGNLMRTWTPQPKRRRTIGEQPAIEASVRRHPSNIPEIGPG